ncbi:MAG: hypothetical protein FH756_17840 [Firmicutes bacterium]|nr:hypothetical protein [Bacillota bacterium]
MNSELNFGVIGIYSGVYFISPIISAILIGLILHKWGKENIKPLIPAFSIHGGLLGLLIVSFVLDFFDLYRNLIHLGKLVEYMILCIGLAVLYTSPGKCIVYLICVYHILVVLMLIYCIYGAGYVFSSALIPSISIRATAIPFLLLGLHNYQEKTEKQDNL